jgi:hypothetical protein
MKIIVNNATALVPCSGTPKRVGEDGYIWNLEKTVRWL